ncbi:hypothetical protein CBA19CS22_14710 [Caballeronia novacaledonica]|jgi:hypothetical protein|uniref:Uncharacterized protein n=2 Tax=Caballeronia novacaledonica TaxID=1544861 RepID=A0ACB5QSB3_9BURK|nr:hypothetical protein CBA19CS22_14710 [Caballeronia novacaledonica]GJH27695.1 hypothetical protein CBA19CS42_24285 [Caballeronia novacaledonica]
MVLLEFVMKERGALLWTRDAVRCRDGIDPF